MKRIGVRIGVNIDRRPKPPVRYVNCVNKFILPGSTVDEVINFITILHDSLNYRYFFRCDT